MTHRIACLVAAWLLAGPALAAPPTVAEVLAQSPAADWRQLDPQNTLLMELGPGRPVLIELAPRFAPRHVANIRTLAKAGYWDGLAIVRVQDNWGLFTLREGIALMTTKAAGKAQTAAGLDTRRGFATPHAAFVAINPKGRPANTGHSSLHRLPAHQCGRRAAPRLARIGGPSRPFP